MKVVDGATGRIISPTLKAQLDDLDKLYRTANPWKVIAKIVEIWQKSDPKRWDAYLFEWKDKKASRKNQYASTNDKSLRYLIDMPEKIHMMIRLFYPSDELVMDKEWLREFGRRFPQFLICEKI